MAPDETYVGACASDDVCMLMSFEPGVAAPIVKPLMVTLKAATLPILPPDVVSTTAVLLVAPQMMFRPLILLAPGATTGVANGAKKSDGYVKTMVPPDGMTDTGENDNVIDAFVLPAMRSECDMVKYEYIGPDGTGKDAAGFALVDTEMPDVLPFVAGPMIRPLSVIVTDTLALIVTVPVVNTMADAVGMAAMPVAPQFMESSGVAETAKKSSG
jgi:hypothetical protein